MEEKPKTKSPRSSQFQSELQKSRPILQPSRGTMNPSAHISHPISVIFRPNPSAINLRASVTGFLHLWAMYVRGFNPSHHCQRCLRGRISGKITTRATPILEEIILDETSNYRVIYLCGVAEGKIADRRSNNLHLPLKPTLGQHFQYNTFNNYTVIVRDAEPLPIPILGDWWNGFSPAFTRCCNFRFGVGLFGIDGPPMGTNEIYGQRI